MVSCVTKPNDSILVESLSVQLCNSSYALLSSAGEQLEALTVGEGKRQTRGGTSVRDIVVGLHCFSDCFSHSPQVARG